MPGGVGSHISGLQQWGADCAERCRRGWGGVRLPNCGLLSSGRSDNFCCSSLLTAMWLPNAQRVICYLSIPNARKLGGPLLEYQVKKTGDNGRGCLGKV